MTNHWLAKREFGNHFMDTEIETSLGANGTPRVTVKMTGHDFCCDAMALAADSHLIVFDEDKASVVKYSSVYDGNGHVDDMSSEHEIHFCPFCGKALR